MKINVFEAFSGIGSQHRALENIGFNVTSVGISDWYIDAIISYGIEYLNLIPNNINRIDTISYLKKFSLSRDSKKPLKTFSGISDEKLSILEQVINKFGNLDIREINGKDLIDKNIDLFTYSFPCQSISQQGKGAGFSKDNEIQTRSGLLWEIERILKEIKKIDPSKLPKTLMMENVKAILNKNFKEDFDLWIKELEKIGYHSSKPFIINSADIGSPQRRERVFLISKLNEEVKDFKLIKNENQENRVLKDILQEVKDRKELDSSKFSSITYSKERNEERYIKKGYLENYSTFNSEAFIYLKDGLVPTITATGANSNVKFLDSDGKIKYLTALEHLLLQDFTKEFYYKLKDFGFSDIKIKFLAGNSINVKVLENIFNYYL